MKVIVLSGILVLASLSARAALAPQPLPRLQQPLATISNCVNAMNIWTMEVTRLHRKAIAILERKDAISRSYARRIEMLQSPYDLVPLLENTQYQMLARDTRNDFSRLNTYREARCTMLR